MGELEDIFMKLLVTNANFHNLIQKFLMRDPLQILISFFDKKEANYLSGAYTINTIIEKFHSYNYLFDQMKNNSSNCDKTKNSYYQQRRMNLGIVGKDYLTSKEKYNLVRFWKEEFFIGIIKIYGNLAMINKEDSLKSEQFRDNANSFKKMF